ncbi:MAG: arylsulfatase [Bradyrhizobium sp.]|nr:arylsulfatase [Bradyrhizobium sp.]
MFLGNIRGVIARSALCAAVAVCLWTASSGPGVAQDGRPNIVLIVADDAGYADLGSFGSEIRTPNIDALASVGVRFTQFGVSATCSPSRAMMLSGADSHVAGLGNMAEFTASNQKGKPGYEGYLNDRVVPISSLLKDAGYNTYMAGKWHMGEEPRHWPAARGFTRDLALIPGGGSHLDDMWGAKGERQLYTRNGKVIQELRPGFHSSEDYTAAIIDNIEENRGNGKPFFAYVALQAPHDPFQLPAEWLDKYKGRYDQGYDVTRATRLERMKKLGIVDPKAASFPRLANVPAWADLSDEARRQSARRMELYAAMVEHMDANIGKLIEYFKAKNLYDNTLIIFLSDNGPEGTMWNMAAPWDNSKIENWGKKGTFIQYGAAWAQVSAGPFRLFKGYLSEGGIRAPLVVSGRGVNGSGRISNAVAHVMDIPATILNAAGVSHPGIYEGREVAPLQGKSLSSVLNGSRASVRGPSDWLGWELFGNRAIRQDNWKLLWLCEPHGPGKWQLYDLKADPGEMNDLASARPKVREQLIRHWVKYAEANNVILPDSSPVCAKGK